MLDMIGNLDLVINQGVGGVKKPLEWSNPICRTAIEPPDDRVAIETSAVSFGCPRSNSGIIFVKRCGMI